MTVATTFLGMSLDEWLKVLPAVAAVLAVIVGPILQWRIAKRQAALQDAITARQLETQREIARRQLADSLATKRQAWIDGLREDVAELLTLTRTVAELQLFGADVARDDSVSQRARAATQRAHELSTRVALRLNPTEKLHVDLINLLMTLANSLPVNMSRQPLTAPARAKLLEPLEAAMIPVVQFSKKILKEEWERVKRGEV